MKPKQTPKIIRMIVTCLVVNVALAFGIAGLAFKFQETPGIPSDKTATTVVNDNPNAKNGEDEKLSGREGITNEGAEDFSKSPFSWLRSNSVIEKKTESLLYK